VVVLLLLAAIIAWNMSSRYTDVRLDAIRQNGYPITLSELNTWYQAVPDSQNNARIYERVFALSGFGNFDINWPIRGQAFSARYKRELADLVVSNRMALALLHSAETSNRCRYSVDFNKFFTAPGGGHGFRVMSGVQLLCAEALLHASNGDSERAVGSFRAAALLGDSEAEEPCLIAQIIRIGCWTIMGQRVEDAMAQTQMTEQQLASLQAMVAGAEHSQGLLRGLAGDRAIGIAVFAEPVYAFSDGWPPYNTTKCLKDDLIVGLSRTTGIFERDKASYLEAMGKAVEAASLPFPERLTLGTQTSSVWAAPRFCSISRNVLPKTSSMFASEGDAVARLRTAQVALAVERFRCRHAGRLPARLEELVPDYLTALPSDPLDGKSLRLEVIDSGYAIYTSGVDSRNGGPLGFRIFGRQDNSRP
jgi:hypothetical protein